MQAASESQADGGKDGRTETDKLIGIRLIDSAMMVDLSTRFSVAMGKSRSGPVVAHWAIVNGTDLPLEVVSALVGAGYDVEFSEGKASIKWIERP